MIQSACMPGPGFVEHGRTFNAEEKRQALEAVLRSETFLRADQLKKFLRYICEMDEVGQAGEITEYSIGTHALGRPEDYSPAADSGVRGRAHALRQKLERFYEIERPDAPLRIALRKGSYVPHFYEAASPFRPVAIQVGTAASPPVQLSEAIAVPKTRTWRSPLWAFVAGLVTASVLLALGVDFFGRCNRQDAVIKEFWGPLANAGSHVLLCLAGTPSLMIKPFPQPPARPDIFRPAPEETAAWYASLRLLGGVGKPYVYHSTEAPLFGGAAAAVIAAQTIAAAGGTVETLPENSLHPAALQNRNVVVIGSPNYSVYASRVLRDTPLTIREDPAAGEEVIAGRKAATNSNPLFVPHRDSNGELVVCYGLITVFANAESKENTRTIIISGVTGAGTEAAMLFFADPTSLRVLLSQLHKDGLSQVPSSYQVVVKGSRDKAVPLNWELAAYRVMQRPPSLE